MSYYIEIDNIRYNLVPGVPHIERLDEELDTAKVVIRKLSRKLPFEPYTEAILVLNDFKRRYLIIKDEPIRASATRKIYTHTIELVSYEKILDLNIMPNIAFSNSLSNGIEKRKTLFEQLDRLKNIYPTRTLGEVANNQGNLFEINQLGDYFLLEKTNQVFLNGKSVLGGIRAILERSKKVAYMNLTKELLFKDLNGFGKNYTNEYNSNKNDFVGESLNQDANFFCNYIKSNVDNGITDELLYYPAKEQFINVRSGSGQVLKEDNCKLILPRPIEYISKVLLRFKANTRLINSSGEPIETGSKERDVIADVTDFFMDKDIYSTLKVPSIEGEYNVIHQANSFYYTKGDNIISLSGNAKELFLIDISKIEYFLSSLPLIVKIGDTSEGKVIYGQTKEKNKWSTLLFNIQYKALDTSLVRTYKQDKEKVNASFNANFSENRIEVDRIIDNMSTMTNRIGNEELTLPRHIHAKDKETKINDYIVMNGSKYKCVKTETAVYQNHKENVATFTKNYNHVSNYVGVDTEYRQYEIPRKGINRNIEYDDFVMLSINEPTEIKENDTYISSLSFLKETLTGIIDDGYDIGGIELFNMNDPSQQGDQVPAIYRKYNGKDVNSNKLKVTFKTMTPAAAFSCVIGLFDSSSRPIKRLKLYETRNGVIEEVENNETIIKDGQILGVNLLNNALGDGTFNGVSVEIPQIKSAQNIDTCIWGACKVNGELISGFKKSENAFIKSRIITPVRKDGAKNTCIFNFGFNDTIVGGNAINFEKGVGYNVPVFYCGENGEMPCLDFSLGKNITKRGTVDEENNRYYQYPKDNDDNGNFLFGHYITITKSTSDINKKLLFIDKDKAEILSMTYQIHFMPTNPQEMTTNNIGEFCALVGNRVMSLGIVERTAQQTDFTFFDDVISDENINDIVIQYTSYNNQYGVGYDRIDLGRVYNKCALVDKESKKVLFACNKPTQYIYAYRSHKR